MRNLGARRRQCVRACQARAFGPGIRARQAPPLQLGGAFFVVIRMVIDGHLLAHLGSVALDFFS